MNASATRPARSALILAAGKSTRFQSEKAKVLHPLCGKPLIEHILDALKGVGIENTLLVVGHQAESVRRALNQREIQFVHQENQLGTGHAVISAVPQLRKLRGSLLVLYSDTPMLRPQTLRRLCRLREREGAALALLTSDFEDPTGYGRVLRDAEGRVAGIVEEKDASRSQKKIREMNPGVYCFEVASLLEVLPRLGNANRQGEYYVTDLVSLLLKAGKKVEAVAGIPPEETLGINDRVQLASAERRLRFQIAQRWMERGVTILDPRTVLIDESVRIGKDAVLYPGVVLEGECRIGSDCIIYGYCHLKNARIGEGAVVDHCSVIRDSRVGARARVGPFAHLRQGAEVGPSARIGNFVEIKKSRLGEGSKSAHLTYIGDAEIGRDVNIGAGVITCNYDGVKKHRTIIEDEAFVGTDSQLVAPVRIGKGAYVAAGSSITEDVPPGALAIGRGRQVNKEGWAAERAKGSKKK